MKDAQEKNTLIAKSMRFQSLTEINSSEVELLTINKKKYSIDLIKTKFWHISHKKKVCEIGCGKGKFTACVQMARDIQQQVKLSYSCVYTTTQIQHE